MAHPGNTTPRRYAIATRIFTPEPAAASFRLEHAAASLAKVAPTTVLTTSFGAEPKLSERVGATVRRWPVLRNADGYVRGYVQYLSFDLPLFFRLLALPRGTVILCEPPPTTGLVTRVAAALRGFPYVYFAADVWSEALADGGADGASGLGRLIQSAVQRTLRRTEQTAMRGAKLVLAVSEAVGAKVAELAPAAQIAVVGNGVDTELFRPLPESELGETPSASGPLLVYTGTASEPQGAAILIEAMPSVLAAHPGARLVFMGHGTDIPAMKELAARTLPGGTVEFLERQEPSEVTRWLNRADAALASIRPGAYGFAVPTKIYVAAACGTPIVFAGPEAAGAVIESGKLGRAVPFDPAATAAAILAQLADSDWDAAAARQWVVDHASLKSMGERVRVAIEGAVANA